MAATNIAKLWDEAWKEDESVDNTESEKKVEQNLPIFNLPIKEVLVGLGQFGIQVPNLDKVPEFILEMSISQMVDFVKSVTFADLQKMLPQGMLDQLKSKLENVSTDEVTQQIKDLINQVH